MHKNGSKSELIFFPSYRAAVRAHVQSARSITMMPTVFGISSVSADLKRIKSLLALEENVR